MSEEYKAEITQDEYLHALALFTLAHDKYREACECGESLNRIIMSRPTRFPGGHVDDAIYTDERQTVVNFDEALRREGIKVIKPAIRKSV